MLWKYKIGDQNGYAYMVLFKLDGARKRARVCNWTHPEKGGREEAKKQLLEAFPNATDIQVL